MRPTFILTAVGACLLIAASASAAEPAAKEPAKPKPVRPKITISKETTYITGPLRPDGYPDYLAALNAHCSRGVTPENNAAVPFWQAVGPKHIPAELRPQFFKLLGIKELPEKGAYLVPFRDFIQSGKGDATNPDDGLDYDETMAKLGAQHGRAQKEPWSPEDFPEIARWLSVNARAMKGVVEGTKRPQWHMPLVRGNRESLLAQMNAELTNCIEVSNLLRIRAMMYVKSNRINEAWEDLLACHRLARLVGQKPLLLAYVQAEWIEGRTCNSDVFFSYYGGLSAAQARRCQTDMAQLIRRPTVADYFDKGERFCALAFVLDLAGIKSQSLSWHRTNDTETDDSSVEALGRLAGDSHVDWDQLLRLVNAKCDRVIAACCAPTYADQRLLLDALRQEAREATRGLRNLAESTGAPPKEAASRVVAGLAAEALASTYGGGFVLAEMAREHGLRVSLAQLALALAGYRADQGRYPASLAALKPKYIADIPKDPFTGNDLIYKQQDGDRGFLLYSVGANARDDGGRTHFYDPDTDKNADVEKLPDDIAIRTPAAVGGGTKP